MKSSVRILAVGPLFLSACALWNNVGPSSHLQPAYDPSAGRPVIVQVHNTGTIAPSNIHQDTLTIGGNGAWQATRVFKFADATPSMYVLATGSLTSTKLQALVNQAFGDPRFVDLPATSDDKSLGGGLDSLTLYVQNGSQSVSVNGKPPTAFSNFDGAVTAATLDMSKVGPSQAGQ